MTDVLPSFLVGTLGLSVAALAAIALSVVRPGVAASYANHVRRMAAANLLVQSIHFAEELREGFHVAFPSALGLAPWPQPLFVTFNLAWLAVWLAAIVAIGTLPRGAAFPLWFLAIASVANGIVHPLLAVMEGGYFAGLWSSPILGVAGVLLLRRLTHATALRASRE